MKKIFLNLWLMLGVVLTFTNCAKELDAPQASEQMKGEEFEIFASAPQTKTINEGLATKWKLDDKLAVFYAEAGTATYSAGQVFNCDVVETGHFTGNLDAQLGLASSNDWYAFYSSAINSQGILHSAFQTPMKSSWLTFGARPDYATPQVQKQKGINSTAHIAGVNYPLQGKALAVAKGTSPAIELSHLSSLIKIQVKNDSGEPLNVTDIELETPATTPIVGLFTYEVNAGKTTLTPVAGNAKSGNPNSSNIAKLEVTGAEIAAGTTASFYLGTAPFVLEAGQTLKIRVNGFEKSLTLSSSTEFKSGAIKSLPVLPYTVKAPEMTPGTYVIAAKDKLGDFYALSSDNQDTGKLRLQDVAIGTIPDINTTYETVNPKLLWEIAQTAEGFTVKNGTSYISWDETNTSKPNNVKLSPDPVSLKIVGSTGGFFNVRNIVSDPATARALAYNAGSGFAFYFNYANPDLYFIPAVLSSKTELVAPAITVTPVANADPAHNSIEVTWTDDPAAGSYIVSCGNLPSQTILQGVQKAQFAGMEYGKYLITIQAIAANTQTHLDSPVSAAVQATLENPATAANIKITFPNSSFDPTTNYTSTWHGTTDGHTWEFHGFNNNSNNTTWTNVRAGRKINKDGSANPTDPYIATDLIKEKISEVQVTVKKAGTTVTLAKLIIASDATFTTVLKEITLAPEVAVMTYMIPAENQLPNQYYKLQYHENGASKNTGELRVEKVELVVVQ